MRLLFLALVLAVPVLGAGHAQGAAGCRPGYVSAVVGGEHRCLHAGQFCSAAHRADYPRYGFDCVRGHLRTRGSTGGRRTATPARTTLLAKRTRTSGCRVRGPLPDRRCSPGAIYTDATVKKICQPGYSNSVRNVTAATKAAVYAEYGLPPGRHGHAYEVDHIVSLELGGSNVLANLYPESETGNGPGFRVKDRLENRVHALVCSGRMGLRHAQRGIARNWVALYREVFGLKPG